MKGREGDGMGEGERERERENGVLKVFCDGGLWE
jgi:hypothetical protein